MERNLFANLPSEIIISIFTRCSVRAIAFSKCVCKSWRNLLDSDDVVNLHLSESAAVAVYLRIQRKNPNPCKVFELEGELDDLESHSPIAEFDFPRRASLEGSANGLIFLRNFEIRRYAVYVCNPITREFIELRFHEKFVRSSRRVVYGFGASKVSGKPKVVRSKLGSDYCHVYTLGTGRWRRVEAASGSAYASSADGGTFVNGNLHWKVSDAKFNSWIWCLDLETERFSTISSPPIRLGQLNFELVNLRECLFAVDDSTGDEVMLWSLKECGVEKSWTIAYMIDQHPDYDDFGFQSFQPIKVFENGDILLLCDRETFFCYSIQTKTYREIGSFGARGDCFVESLLFNPSLRSLKRSFGMEKIISL